MAELCSCGTHEKGTCPECEEWWRVHLPKAKRERPLTGPEQVEAAFKAFDKWLEDRPEIQLLDPQEQVNAYWAEQQD